jgi:hypothetical protein
VPKSSPTKLRVRKLIIRTGADALVVDAGRLPTALRLRPAVSVGIRKRREAARGCRKLGLKHPARRGWWPLVIAEPDGSSEAGSVSMGVVTSVQVTIAGEEQSSRSTRYSLKLEVKKTPPPRWTVPCFRPATFGVQSTPMEGSPEVAAPAALGGAG